MRARKGAPIKMQPQEKGTTKKKRGEEKRKRKEEWHLTPGCPKRRTGTNKKKW